MIVENVFTDQLCRMFMNSSGRKVEFLTTTTTTIYYPFRNYGNLIDDNLAIFKGFQLPEITKKLKTSGSWFK